MYNPSTIVFYKFFKGIILNYTGTSLIREPRGKQIKDSDEVATEIRLLIGKEINKKEFFCLITLNSKLKIIKSRIIHIGTLDKVSVHLRDIVNLTLPNQRLWKRLHLS